MNFKKISILFLSILVLSFFLFNTGYAQSSQGTTVATVSISNAKIVSQADRDFVLSFDITNKVGAQPDIKYGVQLFQITSTKSTKVDETVFDEVLSLGSNSTINKTINYTISNSIPAGNYKIYIVSKNSSGLPLSISLAGQATIGKSTSDSIQILKDSCYISTSTSLNATKYSIDLGFSISPKEQLILKCKVTSTLANTTFKTNFVTKSGSAYGDIVSMVSSSTESVLIKKGTNEITLSLPKAFQSQNYNLSISLESPKAISNIISINYNLMGQTGVIQNVVFDKTYYSKGDDANLQIYSTQYGTGTVSVIVKDENNQVCSATTTQNVNSFSIIDLPIKITKDCNNPNANVILSVGDKVLGSKDFNITSNDADKAAAFKKDMITKIIVVVIAIIVVLLIGLFVKRSKKTAVMMLLMLAIAGFGFNVKAEGCITGNESFEISKTGEGMPFLYVYDLGSSYPVQDIRCTNSNSCLDYEIRKIEVSNDNKNWQIILDNTGVFDNNRINKLTNNYYFVQYDKHSGEDNLFYDLGARRNSEWIYNSNYVLNYRYYRITSGFAWGGDSITFKTFNTQFNNPGCVAPEIKTFSATPNPTISGNSTTLSWTTTGASSCSISGGSIGTVVGLEVNSSYTTPAISNDETYQLSCLNNLNPYNYVSNISNVPSQIVAIDLNNNIYVSGNNFRGFKKFNSNGEFLFEINNYGSGNGQFITPTGIAFDLNNNIYVVDSENNRVQKFNSSGEYISKFGTKGSGIVQFKNPNGIAVDLLGNIYVLDNGNYRVKKFNSSGSYILQFGSKGSGNGQFDTPRGIAIDSDNNIYILDSNGTDSDTGNNRIQKFNSNGTFISKFGSYGTEDGQFEFPLGITIDKNNYVYVTDQVGGRIQKFNSSGEYISKFGNQGTVDGEFDTPWGIDVDSINNIYVGDLYLNKVQKFSNFSATLYTESSPLNVSVIKPISANVSANPSTVKKGEISKVTWNSDGAVSCSLTTNGALWVSDKCNESVINNEYKYLSQISNLSGPIDIAVDSSGNNYITNAYTRNIKKFNSEGTFIKEFSGPTNCVGTNCVSNYMPVGITVDKSNNVYIVDLDKRYVQKFDSSGTYLSQFNFGTGGRTCFQMGSANGLSIDSSGNIYVADCEGYKIQKFDSSGKLLLEFGMKGTGDGQFNGRVSGITLDSFGNIYTVEDVVNGRIQKFDSTGNFVSKFNLKRTGGELLKPMDIVIDSLGYIYITDYGIGRVQVFNSSGTYVYSFASNGTGDGQLDEPQGITLDSSGNLYVVDSSNNRIQKFGKNISDNTVKTCNTSGSKDITIATTTEIGIECRNDHNSITASTTIELDVAGICKIYQAGACKIGELFWIGISADPESVNSGSSTLITWEADGADGCSLYKDNKPFNTDVSSNTGSIGSGNLTKETTFKVVCQKDDEELDASVVVGINEEVNEEPGEQEQNKFGVTLSCDAKQGTSTDYYINRNTSWKVEVNNPRGAKLDRRSWSGTNVSSNSTSNTLDKIYTTVGNKTMNIVDVYSLNGATSSAKCSKTIKLKLDSGTNTEI